MHCHWPSEGQVRWRLEKEVPKAEDAEDSPEQRRQDDQLRLVLKAHALHDEHVRYCQAMGFIAQMLLTEVNRRRGAADDADNHAAMNDTAIEAEALAS